MNKKLRSAITTPLDETNKNNVAPNEDDDEEDEVNPNEKLEKDIRKREYKMEKFTLTAENINNFVILENRRLISDGQVRKIHGAVLDKKNPIGILIINRVNGKDRLIDGNHRIEAVKRFFEYKKSYATVKIECILKVYENLSSEEEKQIYLDEAKRRNESHEDRLNMSKDDITFWKLLNDKLDKFPCEITIYKTVNGLRFKVILKAIKTSKRGPDAAFDAQSLNKDEVVPFAKSLEYEDYVAFKNFMELFIKTFGQVAKTNLYAKSQYFIPLWDIYIQNIQYKDDKTFNERFARVISRADIMSYANLATRDGIARIRELMLNYMNKNYAVKIFK
jgi:hypothetical protein